MVTPREILLTASFVVLVLADIVPVRAVDPAVLQAQQRRVEVMARVSRSVVAIFGSGGAGGGSGVLISPDGFALSNFHVTSSSGDFMKCGLDDGRLYDAVIVGTDPTGDVALLKLLGRDDFPFARMGDSDRLRVGEWVFAMGNPFLLATDFSPTVTYGIVSGTHRYQYPAGTFLEYTDCIQVDASINPGNSGGPLFNSAGELVGINGRGSFEKRGRVNIGAGYAISINQIRNFLDHLRSGRIVDHASLGATVRTEDDGSIVIDRVLQNSEAWRRGLREGTEIVSFAGRGIRSVNQFKNILGIFPAGWRLPLTLRRSGELHDVLIRLRSLHHESELRSQRNPQRQPRRGRTPVPRKRDAPEIPKGFRSMLVRKDGYANYYFNELEQQQFHKIIDKFGDYEPVRGTWIITGQTTDNRAFEFVLADEGLGLTLGNRDYYQSLKEVRIDAEPPGSGGIMLSFHQLRLLLTRRADGFTEFYYLGSEPLDGIGRRVDVYVSLDAAIETRWFVDRENRTLLGFDTRIDDDRDECEIRFDEFDEFGGRQFPSVLRVRHAARQFAVFRIEVSDMRAIGADVK